MLQSLLFVPTLREVPKEAVIVSHQVLLKGGYVKMNAAGVYSYLPLAYKIIKKIENVIREELDAIGCSELLMPSLQLKELWQESGRWDAYGKELMRLKDRHDREFCLGPTHEEVITEIIRDNVTSYKKLPLALYQIQTKFRDEFRPRFGLMRSREFIMKDLYTFHTNEEDLDIWYHLVKKAYENILDRFDLHYRSVRADSGQIGGSSSEEFMVLCDIGEDTICYSNESDFAINTELRDYQDGEKSPDGKGIICHSKGIEVGHIFKLGTKYSEPLKATFIDDKQVKKPIIMGCYGLGVSRLLMAILEQHYNGQEVIWPSEVSPFKIHILPLDKKGSVQYEKAYETYQMLNKLGLEVLFDDRDERPGVKFGDADLIGARFRLIFGRNVTNDIIEFKDVKEKIAKEIKIDEIKVYIKNE